MKIREFLTEANWGKGAEVINGDKKCLLSALGCCFPDACEREIASRKIRNAIFGSSLMGWNDAPERTFAEAKALVERLDI